MNTYTCYENLKDLKAELALLVEYYRTAARADKGTDSRKGNGSRRHTNL